MLYKSELRPKPESQFVSHLVEKKVFLAISQNRDSKLNVELESSSRGNGP